MSQRVPDPDAWAAPEGLGSCFHRALTRWATFQKQDSAHGWRVAVGYVDPPQSGPIYERAIAMGATISARHVHAWLERGGEVISAVNGQDYDRDFFYIIVGIQRESVRLVNPRKLIRAHGFTRSAVDALLTAWGGRYRVEPTGGVVGPED